MFAHANNQSQGESKLITVNDGQVDAETFLKWQHGPGFRCRPLRIVFASSSVCREITILQLWVFLHQPTVWVIWPGKLTGLTVGIIRKAVFCSREFSAKHLKERKVGRDNSPPRCTPAHESHLAALNCRKQKTIRAKQSNICMHDFCYTFSASSNEYRQSTNARYTPWILHDAWSLP